MKISFVILFFFVLIFGLLSGCTGTSASTTSLVSSNSDEIDPILGTWNKDLTVYSNITFSQSGNIVASIRGYKEDIGDWIKKQDNSYSLNFLIDGKSENYTFTYDKSTDTLHNQMDDGIFYRVVETATSARTNPTIVQTKVITASPTQDNYQYCRYTYPGSSYDPSTNKCVYPTSVPTQIPTRNSIFKDPVIGSWKSIKPAYQDYYYTMAFFENGKAMKGGVTGGTWEKYDDTHFAFTYYGADAYAGAYRADEVFIYDPNLDTLTLRGNVYKRE